MLTPKEDHRRGEAECLIVVLRRILEHLLHRTRTTGRVDYATLGYGQQTIFAYAVVEIFGYMACKGRCRLVAIKPRGNTYAAILLIARITLHNLKGRLQPPLILKLRGTCQHLHRLLQLLLRASSHPRTQMRSLHSSRASAADHQLTLLGEQFACLCHGVIYLVRARERVTTHNGHHGSLVILRKHIVQSIANGVVV